MSDERLMLAFTLGSADAFAELFQRYKQKVDGFFRRRLSDSAHAEELTQETFLVLLRAAKRYEPRALFRTYLYAIGFKILRSHRRKAAFRATFLVPAAAADPSRDNATEAGLWVRRAVEKLDPVEREIILLPRVRAVELRGDRRLAGVAYEHGSLAAVPGAHGASRAFSELKALGRVRRREPKRRRSHSTAC